ncbi:hypothetical protein AB0D67_22795 [Streptosporangium sp. NPDC048047]|uniref:hypothetical protein n=1 Tax=Streptosporangium sp. NPDC048047 TaxID=3155748 RepID=UPI00342EFD0E
MSENTISIARVFDGVEPGSGRPFFDPGHPRAQDLAERELLAAYLDGGRVIAHERGRDPDRLDPSRGEAVPRDVRTDGRWVWTDAVTYYLREHGLLPDPGLCGHAAAHEYRCPEVGDAEADRALRALGPSSAPLLTLVPDAAGTRAEPLVLETSAGSLSVSPDLTPEEFAVLDEMRRAAAAERDGDS